MVIWWGDFWLNLLDSFLSGLSFPCRKFGYFGKILILVVERIECGPKSGRLSFLLDSSSGKQNMTRQQYDSIMVGDCVKSISDGVIGTIIGFSKNRPVIQWPDEIEDTVFHKGYLRDFDLCIVTLRTS